MGLIHSRIERTGTRSGFPGRAGGAFWVWVIGGIYALAVLLRLWRYLSAEFSNENALIGIMARDILRGKAPLFFYGQDYMGALEAYLSAPFIALFGPSSFILNLWPPLASLVAIAAMHRILLRFFSPAGVAAGLAAAAFPSASLMFWSGYAQAHIIFGFTFCSLLALQTVRLWERQTWTACQGFLWGIWAGLALYCFPQSVVAILPCGLCLVIAGFRRIRFLPLAASILGAGLAGFPVWHYNLSRGFLQAGQADALGVSDFTGHLADFLTNALPIALGFVTPAVGGQTAPFSPGFILYMAVALYLLLAVAGIALQSGDRAKRPLLIVILIAVCNAAVLLFSIYGRELKGPHQAYLLPFALILPPAWAWWAEKAGKARHAAALALAFMAAAISVSGYGAFTFQGYHLFNLSPEQAKRDAFHRHQAAQIQRAGFKAVYREPSYLWNFFAGGKPCFSDLWEDRAPEYSWQVDASPAPAFWAKMEPSLKALGLAFRTAKVGEALLYHSVEQPRQAGALLKRNSWHAESLAGADLGRALSDSNFATGFSTRGPGKDGQGFVLDLGSEQTISGAALIPSGFKNGPAGFVLETAGADRVFARSGGNGEYWGPFYFSGPHPFLKARFCRIETYFKPVKARYVRFRLDGPTRYPVSLPEVLLYGPGLEDLPGWEQSWQQARHLLLQRLPRRILADAWTAAKIKLELPQSVQCMGANRYQDVFGSEIPKLDAPVWLDPTPGNSILATTREAGAIAESLSLADAAYRLHTCGRLALFDLLGRSLGKPLRPVAITSGRDQTHAALLAKGELILGRWASGAPQEPETGLSIDLGRNLAVGMVEIESPDHPEDFARHLAAMASKDGKTWQPVDIRLVGPLHFSGQLLLARPGARRIYRLEPGLKTRFLRIFPAKKHPIWWWSVQKIALYPPAPAKP